MKNIFKKIITFLLAALTRIYLAKNRIEVIAITGSAGKTTAKLALAQLLTDSDIYTPTEAYNTEIGVPLAVFKLRTPERIGSLGSWLKILLKMFLTIFKKADYKRIVLELGADRPGDISHLTSFIKPHIAIVTTVLPVHMENFKDVEAVALEKSEILSSLTENDLAVLNNDDILVRKMAKKTKSQILFVGQGKGSDLSWGKEQISPDGTSVDFIWKEEKHSLNLQIIAPQLLPSLFSALAAALYLGKEPKKLLKKLEEFKPVPGRMNLVKGTNDSTIIDDSYNANPASTIAALDVLSRMPGRKIAVLGNMNELGDYERKGHEEVGEKAGEACDILITVGELAKAHIVPKAEAKMKKESIQSFDNPYAAGEYLKKTIKKGDIILVKGSQNKVFVEETVKIIMATPAKAGEELVRQSGFWQKKKEKCFK